jgi:hypothetical protein
MRVGGLSQDGQRWIHPRCNAYITPKDMLAGRQKDIHAERRSGSLKRARKQQQIRRQQAALTHSGATLLIGRVQSHLAAGALGLSFQFGTGISVKRYSFREGDLCRAALAF